MKSSERECDVMRGRVKTREGQRIREDGESTDDTSDPRAAIRWRYAWLRQRVSASQSRNTKNSTLLLFFFVQKLLLRLLSPYPHKSFQ
ncbi:unnamed protein product [Caenorhabditis nigoni]